MSPFPCLTAKKSESTQYGQEHPFHHCFTIMNLTRAHGHNHGDGTHDQYKSHQAHKSQGHGHFTDDRKTPEHLIGIGPGRGGKTYGSVGNQESTEGESITHKKIPHHEFTIFNIEGASTSTPPFLTYGNCLCHEIILNRFTNLSKNKHTLLH